jgi:chromosome segregation ATPase
LQTRISKELQEAQQTASQNQANEASLQRELQSERLKLDAATKELSEVKKQLEDSRLSASRATSSTTQDQPSNLNLLQSSPGTSHVSSDFAINIIRQSSLQQDALQQKILTLQTQLESAQNDLAARTKELEAKQEEHIKWIKEMNAVKASMLTDIHHIKEDREGLRVQFNLLQTEKVRLTSDNARFNEENRRQRQEQAELMTRYMSELQVRLALFAN